MKKTSLIILLIVLFFPLISSLNINMPANISSGQTVIATVEGNFIDPIQIQNVQFYRGYVQTSFDYDVTKIGSTYYIYFQTLNKPQNNYSINITGVRYYIGSQISTEVISENFVLDPTPADFYVDKGFVQTSGNFSLIVQNLNPSSITIDIQTETNSGFTGGFFDFLFKNDHVVSGESITLLSGDIEEVDITLENITETTLRTITLSTENTRYEIPIYLIIQSIPQDNQLTSNETIINTTTENNTIVTINETKNESTENKGSFWDLFKKENKTESTVANKTANTSITINGTKITNTTLKTCSQLSGYICGVNTEVCDGTTVTAKDDLCCIGTCVPKQKSNTGKIIGWSIIGLIIILLILFKAKLNRTRKKRLILPDIPRKKF